MRLESPTSPPPPRPHGRDPRPAVTLGANSCWCETRQQSEDPAPAWRLQSRSQWAVGGGPGRAYLGVEAPSEVRRGQAHPRAEPSDLQSLQPVSVPTPPSFSFLSGNQGAEERPNSLQLLGSSATAVTPAFGSHPVCVRPSGGWGGPREVPLPAQALQVLAPHGAENLIAPPGGRGWGQVPRDLIGARTSPRRIPQERETAPHEREAARRRAKGRDRIARLVSCKEPSFSSAACLPKKCKLRSRAP